MAASASNLSLNRCYLANPQDQVQRNYISGICLRTASIVAMVAACALASYIYLFCSFMPDSSSATFPVLAALSIAAAIPFPMFAAGLWNKGNEFFENAKKEQRIIELEQILTDRFVQNGELDCDKVNESFKNLGIAASKERLSKIQQGLTRAGSIEKATQVWIRVAACFIFEFQMASKKLPEKKEPEALSEEQKAARRTERYTEQHLYKESHTIKHILNAALFALILEEPSTQAADLSDLGSCIVRPFITRAGDSKKDNHYFIFKDKQVAPISARGKLLNLAHYISSLPQTDFSTLLDRNLLNTNLDSNFSSDMKSLSASFISK